MLSSSKPIIAGDDIDLSIRYSEGGTPIDITGCTLQLYIKANPTDLTYLVPSPIAGVVTNGPQGLGSFHVAGSLTAGLQFSSQTDRMTGRAYVRKTTPAGAISTGSYAITFEPGPNA